MHAMLTKARSHKLKCTGCTGKIQKGEEIIVQLKEGKMVSGYCRYCKKGRLMLKDMRESRIQENLQPTAT